MPEADLLALSPITRLVLDSLIQELIATYDQAAAAGRQDECRPVLFLIDEAGRTASLASLPDHLTTVRSRGISLIVAIQTLSQLTALYAARADDVINNCQSHHYYRPFSYKTAADLQQWLGDKSEFAQSYSTHGEHQTSEARSEREVPLMPADELRLIDEDDILGFCAGIRPFRARRMNWHRFPLLEQRAAIPPPPVPILPALPALLPVMTVPATAVESEPGPTPEPYSSHPLDRSLYRRWPRQAAANGIRKPGSP